MRRDQAPAADIDAYIAGFPAEVGEILQKIRETIRRAIPDAEEAIRYDIPTFRRGSNVIHFAAFRSHVGVYPAPRGDEAFREELAGYGGGKGTVQFPLDRPIPYDLVARIATFRAAEEAERSAARKKR
jgi:uncharacterized protein YdhG (YjbR/CyaY superfamily)